MEVDINVAEDLEVVYYKEKLLIDLLRDISTNKTNLSESLKEKLGKVLADIDLSLYMSLHKANDTDHRSSNIFGKICFRHVLFHNLKFIICKKHSLQWECCLIYGL